MSFLVSASGLTAQRTRLNVIAENLANASTTRPRPYRRKMAVFAERLSDEMGKTSAKSGASFEGNGVRVLEIQEDQGPQAFRMDYQPGHPDADAQGYVLMPNINPVDEMVNLIDAMRAYEANVTALNATKEMMGRTLDIGRV